MEWGEISLRIRVMESRSLSDRASRVPSRKAWR